MSPEMASASAPVTAPAVPGDPAVLPTVFEAAVPIDMAGARPALVAHLAAALAADWRRRHLTADRA